MDDKEICNECRRIEPNTCVYVEEKNEDACDLLSLIKRVAAAAEAQYEVKIQALIQEIEESNFLKPEILGAECFNKGIEHCKKCGYVPCICQDWQALKAKHPVDKIKLLAGLGVPVDDTFVEVRDNEFIAKKPLREWLEVQK